MFITSKMFCKMELPLVLLCVLQIILTVNCWAITKGTASEKFFACKNGKEIIPLEYRCDNENDCSDSSDEAECSKPSEEQSAECHMCAHSNQCIDKSKVCDHQVDCPYRDDEGEVCEKDLCYALKCAQHCELVNGTTPQCSCNKGFTFEDSNNHQSQCVDIDECKQNVCSHACANSEGSFECVCFDGYELVNLTTCLAKHISPILYYSVGMKIREYDIRSKASQTVVNSQHREWDQISSIVRFANRLFFVGTSKHNETYSELIQVTLNDELLANDETKLDFDHKYGRIRDIAVDWVHGHLYLATQHKIIVCRIEPFVCAPILIGLKSVHSVAVLPTERMLVWSQDARDGEAGLFTAYLDGMDKSEPHFDIGAITWPTKLALDEEVSKLYWIDKMDGSIQCYGLNSANEVQIQHVVNHTEHTPTSIDVFEDTLYWISLQNNSILMSNKRNGSNTRVLIDGSRKSEHKLGTISVYHPLNHRKSIFSQFFSDPCLDNPCSHICLLTKHNANSYVCACPEDMYYQENNICGYKHNSSSLIVSAGYQVMRLFADSKVTKNLITEQHHLIDEIAFNFEREELYVHDRYHNQIGVYHLKLSALAFLPQFSPLVESRLREVAAMVYDVNTDYLYWVDRKKGTLEVTNTKGKRHRAILCSGLEGPLSLALNAPEKKWYIGLDGGLSGERQIISLDMDGNNRELIVESSDGTPMELTTNPLTSELFWGDPVTRQIQYMFTSNRSTPRPLDDNRVDTINSLTLVNHTNLCWSNAESLNLYCRQYDNTQSDNNIVKIHTLSLLFIRDVPDVSRTRVTSGDPQTVLYDVCLGNPCDHLCLISSRNGSQGYSCACSDGFKLDSNGKSCKRNVAWKGKESKEVNEQMESFGKEQLLERISTHKQNSNGSWEVAKVTETTKQTWGNIWLQVAFQVITVTTVVVIVFCIYKVVKRYRTTLTRYLHWPEEHETTRPIADDQSNGTENADLDFTTLFRHREIEQNNNKNVSVAVN